MGEETDVQTLLSPILLLLPLLAAAWHDVATRHIPNALVGVTAGLGLLLRATDGAWPVALSAMAAAALFAALLIPFARGWLGGGDVKLLAALGLGLSPALLLDALTCITLFGGALAASYLLLRGRMPAPAIARRQGALGRVLALEAVRIRRGAPLPYGVAIALGAGAAITLAGG